MEEQKYIKVLRITGECKVGGVETIALNYYKNLDHHKIKMDFLFYGESVKHFDDELKRNGDKVFNVVEYSKNMIKSIKQIRDIVKREKYDIVHAQLNSLNFFPLLGAYLGGAKIRIASNHSTANLKYEFKKSLIKYILRPTSGMMATNYTACSKYAGRWGFGKNKQIKIIHNAIDLEQFKYDEILRKKIRKRENWDNKFVIGHVGRFVEQKNQMFIVEIFKEVHKKNPNSILIFIGDGKLMEKVKQKVHEYDLDEYVKFLGVKFNVNELMQGMDLFLFPSLYEGLGNVITEAQAVSLQSIASNVVPSEVKMTEYVEFISLKKDAKFWADRVLKYGNGYKRRDTYDDLVKAGYEIKSAAKELENYYIDLYEGQQKEEKNNEDTCGNTRF